MMRTSMRHRHTERVILTREKREQKLKVQPHEGINKQPYLSSPNVSNAKNKKKEREKKTALG